MSKRTDLIKVIERYLRPVGSCQTMFTYIDEEGNYHEIAREDLVKELERLKYELGED